MIKTWSTYHFVVLPVGNRVIILAEVTKITSPYLPTMSNQDTTPGDEAAEPGKPDNSNKQNKNDEPSDFLNDQLYDKQDLLQIFHISGRTLQTWRTKGLIEFIRLRGKIMYPKKFVEEMLRNNRVRKS